MSEPWQAIFEEMHPDHFSRPHIRAIAPGEVYEDMVLDLRTLADLPPAAFDDFIAFLEGRVLSFSTADFILA